MERRSRSPFFAERHEGVLAFVGLLPALLGTWITWHLANYPYGFLYPALATRPLVAWPVSLLLLGLAVLVWWINFVVVVLVGERRRRWALWPRISVSSLVIPVCFAIFMLFGFMENVGSPGTEAMPARMAGVWMWAIAFGVFHLVESIMLLIVEIVVEVKHPALWY